MAEQSTIKIDCDELRGQADQLKSNVSPVFAEWNTAVDSYGTELESYSSDFGGNVSTILHETAASRISQASKYVKSYIGGLNKTADIHEENEKATEQGLSQNANSVSSN